MVLTLANFKKAIPLSILERGKEYFEAGRVTDLEFSDSNVWSAQVEGTERYQVQIEQATNGKLTCSCTCPYDADPYCKHIAAVLYAIEAGLPDRTAGKNARPRQTTGDKLREALSDVSREELLEVVLEVAGRDRQFANQLLLRFAKAGQSKTSYSKMVKDALRTGYGDYGFIDYRGSMDAASAVSNVLTHADAALARGHVEQAAAIFEAVFENVVDVIGQADDSSGSLGGCVAHALEGLGKAAEAASPEERQALFQYFVDEARKPRYQGWDWKWDLLEMAAGMVNTAETRQQVFASLDAVAAGEARTSIGRDSWFVNYARERAALIKLEVIERDEGAEAVDAFIAAHVELDKFRMMQIERHLERGELDAARHLAADGVKRSTDQRMAGLVSEYRTLLLQVAQRQHDTTTVIQLARELLLGRDGFEYYDVLAKTVAADQWPTFRETLIRDAERNRMPELVAQIYAREETWPRLLEMAQQGWTHTVEHYRKDLEKRFPAEVAAIYEKTVYKMLEQVSNRTGYQEACAFLKRMKALGSAERAAEVIQDLKARYRNRRALLEELGRI